METKNVFLGIGGNVGDTLIYLSEGFEKISLLKEVSNLVVSRFYETTPVTPIPQNNYINAACSFQTTCTAYELVTKLQQIEKEVGKVPKAKEAPRIIDIDIILFGQEIHNDPTCQIPHPRWKERLFVLVPLADLTDRLLVPTLDGTSKQVNLNTFIRNHQNPNKETITVLEENELCKVSQ